MNKKIKLGLASAVITFSQLAFSEVSVIVHPSNGDSMDKSSIAKLYMGKSKSFPGGEKALPLNQNSDAGATAEFNDKVLGKDASQLKSYWSRLMFTGKGQPPKAVGGDADVLGLVSNNPNAIGYVSSSAVTGDVKVVATF